MTKSDTLALSSCHNIVWIFYCFHNQIKVSCHFLPFPAI